MSQYNPIDLLSQIKQVEVPDGVLSKILMRIEQRTNIVFSLKYTVTIAASIILLVCLNFGFVFYKIKFNEKMAVFSQINSTNELYK